MEEVNKFKYSDIPTYNEEDEEDCSDEEGELDEV